METKVEIDFAKADLHIDISAQDTGVQCTEKCKIVQHEPKVECAFDQRSASGIPPSSKAKFSSNSEMRYLEA